MSCKIFLYYFWEESVKYVLFLSDILGDIFWRSIYFPDGFFSPFSLTNLLNRFDLFNSEFNLCCFCVLYGCNSTSITSEDLKSLHLFPPTFFNVFLWVYFCLSCSFSFVLSVFFKYLEIFGYRRDFLFIF